MVEHQLTCHRAARAQFMELLAGDEPVTILRLLFYEVKIKTFKAHFRIHRCHHCSEVSNGSIGDPLLSPIDPPTSVHFGGKRPCSAEVRAGLVLRKADRADLFAFDGRDKNPLLNILVSNTAAEKSSHQDLHNR